MRTVEVTRVGVVHTSHARLSQDITCGVGPQTPEASNLHRSITHPVQADRGIGKYESATVLRLSGYCVFRCERGTSLADFFANAMLTAVYDNGLPANECGIVTRQEKRIVPVMSSSLASA
jgi:hypothetical protein